MQPYSQATTVVLVEPLGALNLGSVARLCENFGIKELRLVAPRCDPGDPEAIRMAVRGRDLLEKAKQFTCLLDAIADCHRVVATCGRRDHGEIHLDPPEKALSWLLKTSASTQLALVFGREDRGLTNEELQLANKVLTLQTSPHYPSLNLSHAVAIVLHELQRCKQNLPDMDFTKNQPYIPATPNQLNDFIEDAQGLLLEVGFLLEHTAQARMRKVKAMLQRAEVRSDEISLIRGVLRQIRWAINTKNS